MSINIPTIKYHSDTFADMPRLQATIKECDEELDTMVNSVASGSLCEHSARYAIYYLQHEKTCLEGRIQQIKKG